MHFTSFVIKINFNIIFTSTPRSPKLSLFFVFLIPARSALRHFAFIVCSSSLLQNHCTIFILLDEDKDGLSVLILFYLWRPVADTCLTHAQ
jgi:hypothetical protein